MLILTHILYLGALKHRDIRGAEISSQVSSTSVIVSYLYNHMTIVDPT
jgi:hypothetical protein